MKFSHVFTTGQHGLCQLKNRYMSSTFCAQKNIYYKCIITGAPWVSPHETRNLLMYIKTAFIPYHST